MKSVLSIAGSDSSGGAGIQADIKTIAAHGLFAQTAITALTAQNTMGVEGVVDVSPEFVREQIRTVFADIRPDAVKIGMVSSADIAVAIAEELAAQQAEHIVLDPVMVATSGSALSSDGAVAAVVAYLFPLAEVVTPNLPEAEVLWGHHIAGEDDMVAAARAIQHLSHPGAWVLVKGGHRASSADDVLVGAAGCSWLRGEHIDTENTHGTGCTLSSAIACGLALGQGVEEACRNAKGYVAGALQHDPQLGRGSGPLDHMWRYRA